MKQFIVYNNIGNILRTGSCQDNMLNAQTGQDEFVIEGRANDRVEKIVEKIIVPKTQSEIDAGIPTPTLIENTPAQIIQKDWDDLLGRVDLLEK